MKKVFATLAVVAAVAVLSVVTASSAQAKADFSCVNSGASGQGWSYEIIRCR